MTTDAAPSTLPTEPARQPAFLTIEEAAAVLRIGRTAAYMLAGRWEKTGGAEGLPVVRFGRLLRVPVHELQRLAGGAIDLTPRAPTGQRTLSTSASLPRPSASILEPDSRHRDTARPSNFPKAS